VEKIRLIHRSGSVYYHYQFIYLLKLFKTVTRLRVDKAGLGIASTPGKPKKIASLQTTDGKVNTRHRELFVCRKNWTPRSCKNCDAGLHAQPASAATAQPFLFAES
jgi:hypothetical protein